jgi:hypothetical protein
MADSMRTDLILDCEEAAALFLLKPQTHFLEWDLAAAEIDDSRSTQSLRVDNATEVGLTSLSYPNAQSNRQEKRPESDQQPPHSPDCRTELR